MNECLNSDDEDEEHHRVLFYDFESPHRKSFEGAVIRGIGQETSLISLPLGFISPAYDKKQGNITPFLPYGKYNELIT
jgi:hypothetical protein